MLYIFVGPDGAGKSTCFSILKNKFANGRHSVFIKESHTTDNAEKSEKIARVGKVARGMPVGYDVFFDRATLIDDFVYNPIIDGKEPFLNIDEIVSVFKNLSGRCKIIYFTASNEALASRIGARGDQYINAEQIVAIKKRYGKILSKVMMCNNVDLHVVDTTNTNERQTYENVLGIIRNKKMKFAHIVPVGSLDVIRDKQYHMCLAHLVKENEKYRQFYFEKAMSKGHFVLMDNGAAEGSQLSNEELLECYSWIMPDEIVLPDTLCDKDDTIRKMYEAINFFVHKNKVGYRLMAVPQGANLEEWKQCAEEMVKNPYINSIGVSKFLQMATKDDCVRYHAVQFISKMIEKYKRYDIEVHLLGCSEPLRFVNLIAKTFPFVRGCDSALGYLYAQAGQHPFADTERPAGEIDFIGGKGFSTLDNTLAEIELSLDIFDNNSGDPTWRD